MGTLKEKELLSGPEVLPRAVPLISQTPNDDHGQSSFGSTAMSSFPVSFSNIPSGRCQLNTL